MKGLIKIMKATVKSIDIDNYKRVIVTSDIHGDYEGFIKLINEINFNNEDCMIIVGDILEKGKDSLKLLRKIMKYKNIYLVLGNNDTLFSDWKSGEVIPQDMLWYMNSRRNSIFIEMAKELNCRFETENDILKLEQLIFETYKDEIKYLNDCPHIIDTKCATFVHAGINPDKSLSEQDIDDCLSMKEFANSHSYFDKLVIVGHWPASNYCQNIINANCYHNEKNNIMSIDGGNSMKSWEQINYLIIENNIINSYAIDRCKKIICLEKQNESDNPISLIFPNTEVIVKEKNDETCLCYIPFLNSNMHIKNEYIYEYKRKNYCYDFTTYYLKVDENERVSYCEDKGEGILIKKNGIVGLYKGKIKEL